MGDRLLLTNESVSLGYSDRGEDWVLTKDGWIARVEDHDLDGLTKLFRLLRTRDIDKVEYFERPWGNLFDNAIVLSWLVSTIGLFLAPFYWGIDAFWNGCESEGISFEDCYMVGGQGSNLETYLLAGPFVFMIVVGWVSKLKPFDYLKVDTLRIEHDGGSLMLEERKFVSEIIFLWFAAALWRSTVDPLDGGFSESRDGIMIILIIILVWGLFRFYKGVFSKPKVPEISFGTLREFFEEIKGAIGMSGGDSGTKGERLIEVIGPEIEPIKESIEKYREELEQFDSRFEEMWESTSYWIGIVATRTTMENLLKIRLRKVRPSAERKGRGFANYMDALNQLEDPPSEIRDKMRKVRDSFNHTKDAKKEDYIVALRDALTIIEWNFANPPERSTPNGA